MAFCTGQARRRRGEEGKQVMNSITLDQVMAWHPCYSREKIESLFGGRESLTVAEILELPIPASDRLWAVLREDLIPAPILHEFACRCAEQGLAASGDPDPRSVAAIAAKRAWVRGEISDQALAAARAAAWDAAEGAAQATAWYAAEGAAWGAASAAAEGAAWGAASASAWVAASAAFEAAQVEILRSLI